MTTGDFEAGKWVEKRHAEGKCACGECQCRARVAFEAREGVRRDMRKTS